jgi:recombination protein RecT
MATKIQEQVATTNNVQNKSMQTYIKSMEGEIKKALPSVITPERFTRMVLSAISVNPQLA